MKNYNKPNLEVVKIAPSVSIAAAGLEGWVLGNDIKADVNITTYEYSSSVIEY